MSYLQFHFVFILPALVLVGWLSRKHLNKLLILGLLAISVFAVIYTIPWDSHLIIKKVWTYPTSAVIGTIGVIPIEEYLFMLLQPLLVGLLTIKFLFHKTISNSQTSKNYLPNILGFLFWTALSILGFYFLKENKTYYWGIILAWAAPVLALQWAYGGNAFWKAKKAYFLSYLIATLYLCVADRIALDQGIWHIEEAFSTEIFLLGLPIEEFTFFSLTNLLVIGGISLVQLKSPGELFEK